MFTRGSQKFSISTVSTWKKTSSPPHAPRLRLSTEGEVLLFGGLWPPGGVGILSCGRMFFWIFWICKSKICKATSVKQRDELRTSSYVNVNSICLNKKRLKKKLMLGMSLSFCNIPRMETAPGMCRSCGIHPKWSVGWWFGT